MNEPSVVGGIFGNRFILVESLYDNKPIKIPRQFRSRVQNDLGAIANVIGGDRLITHRVVPVMVDGEYRGLTWDAVRNVGVCSEGQAQVLDKRSYEGVSYELQNGTGMFMWIMPTRWEMDGEDLKEVTVNFDAYHITPREE